MITAINTLDRPMLGYNLITNQQLDFVSSELIIQAEDVNNDHENLVAIRYDTPLV